MQPSNLDFLDLHQRRVQRLEAQYRDAEQALAKARLHYHSLREMPLQCGTAMNVAMQRIHAAHQTLFDLDECLESVRRHEPVA